VLHHVAHQAAEKRARFLAGGKHVPELSHAAAEERPILDERDLHAAVAQIARRHQARDTAADDQRGRVDRDATLVERHQVAGAVDGRPHESRGFRGGRLLVLDHPGHVLADIHVLEEVLVEAAALDRATERELVERRRTGRHHDAGQPVLPDLLLDEGLTRVRAVEHVRRREDDVRHAGDLLGHPLDVHGVGDVAAALADEDTDARGLNLRRRFARAGTSRVEHGRPSSPPRRRHGHTASGPNDRAAGRVRRWRSGGCGRLDSEGER
jgi:hypothetical protein